MAHTVFGGRELHASLQSLADPRRDKVESAKTSAPPHATCIGGASCERRREVKDKRSGATRAGLVGAASPTATPGRVATYDLQAHSLSGTARSRRAEAGRGFRVRTRHARLRGRPANHKKGKQSVELASSERSRDARGAHTQPRHRGSSTSTALILTTSCYVPLPARPRHRRSGP